MVSYWEIFKIFGKIGAFTIGGGIPMIAAIKSELVERGWLNDEDFLDIIALAQSAPGLFAVNISILTGYKLRGTKGSVVATIASCLPPFLIILLIAMFFTEFKDNEYVIRAFKGIRPVVVALIGVPMIDMIRATKMKWWSWVIVVASLVLVCVLHFSPIYIIVCVIAGAVGISWFRNRRGDCHGPDGPRNDVKADGPRNDVKADGPRNDVKADGPRNDVKAEGPRNDVKEKEGQS